MANIFNRTRKVLKEAIYGVRVKPNDSSPKIPIAKDKDSLVNIIDSDDLELFNLTDLSQINSFRTLSLDRNEQYNVYDMMAEDSIIASALELYADDATQYSSKGSIIWAESDDTDISAFANNLIDDLNLNQNAWSHIYSMIKYGDLYLETFRDEELMNLNPVSNVEGSNIDIHKKSLGSRLESHIEVVSDPSEIFDLSSHGKTVGFIRVPNNITEENHIGTSYKLGTDIETVVLPPDKYIHLILNSRIDRHPETIDLSFRNDNDEDDIITNRYNVLRGKSILHDVYKSFRELRLMEDSILLNRVTRSSIIRIMQVEVGDMPKAQSRELLKRMKNLIEQKNYMDKSSGSYSSDASPGAVDNIIYVPTKDGKGNITSSSIGGDVDIKSIADIEYYKNKLYGGLKVPKQFLGDNSDESSLGNGSSLTKLDSRYARTIKRIQNAYISGITTLINIYAIDKGLDDHVNQFTIKMVSPATTEDAERDEMISSRMDLMENFINLVDTDSYSKETKKEILLYFVNNYLSEPELAKILEEDDTDLSSKEDPFMDDDIDMLEDRSFGSHSGPSKFSRPSFIGDEEGFTDFNDIASSPDSSNNLDNSFDYSSPGITTSEEFGDFESEY